MEGSETCKWEDRNRDTEQAVRTGHGAWGWMENGGRGEGEVGARERGRSLSVSLFTSAFRHRAPSPARPLTVVSATPPEMPALALCPLARGAAPVAPSRRPSVAARAEADATAAAPAGKGAIRIKLKSFNKTLITESAAAIVGVARETGASFSGPVPLPTR